MQIDTLHVVARSPYLVLFSWLGAYPPAWLDAALGSGQLFEIWAHEACFVPVEDLLLHRCYNQHAKLLQKSLNGWLRAIYTTLLSPLDPLVWDRERALALRSFDYRIECYTPAQKRNYASLYCPSCTAARWSVG